MTVHSPGPIIWTFNDLTIYLRASLFFVTLGVRQNRPKSRRYAKFNFYGITRQQQELNSTCHYLDRSIEYILCSSYSSLVNSNAIRKFSSLINAGLYPSFQSSSINEFQFYCFYYHSQVPTLHSGERNLPIHDR